MPLSPEETSVVVLYSPSKAQYDCHCVFDHPQGSLRYRKLFEAAMRHLRLSKSIMGYVDFFCPKQLLAVGVLVELNGQ